MKYQCRNCGFMHDRPLPTDGSRCKCGSGFQFTELSDAPKPQEIGGEHYQQGVKTSPWDLQLSMKSSGNAYVDARRADAIKYAFRMKGDLKKLAEDLRKAADCALAGAKEIEAMIEKSASSIKSKMDILKWERVDCDLVSKPALGYIYRVRRGDGGFFEAVDSGTPFATLDTEEQAIRVCENRWHQRKPETPSSI